MSFEIKAIGDAELFLYNHLNRQRRPYLRRNVRVVLRSLTMGSMFSSLNEPVPGRTREEPMASDDEEGEDPRPTKRRRLFNDRAIPPNDDGDDARLRMPFGHVMNESKRGANRSSKPELIKPVNFYGKPPSASPVTSVPRKPVKVEIENKRSIERILPRTLVNFSEYMRVDLLQINTKHAGELVNEGCGQVAEIKCRCQVALFCATNEKNPGDVKPQDYYELCRLVQTGTLRVTIGEDGDVSRDIVLPAPFIFPPDHFLATRDTWKSNGQRDQYAPEITFADRYSLQVTIQCEGRNEAWPPLGKDAGTDAHPVSDLLDNGQIPAAQVRLIGKTNPWLSSESHERVGLELNYRNLNERIKYCLNMQVRWTLPSHLSERVYKSTRSKSTRIAVPSVDPTPGILESPVARHAEDVLLEESPGDSRASRRRSNVPTYNLKALSSIAQGKSPRAPRTQKLSFEQQIADHGELTVTYSFGKADAAEAGIKRETTISGLHCPFCLSRNRTLDDLRLHLNTDHSAYKFHLRRPNPPRVAYFIELVKNNHSTAIYLGERSRTVQLRQSMSLFDLEKHLSGDESWTKARTGPIHNLLSPYLIPPKVYSSLSSSPHDSRHSSPNTSNHTDDMMDLENCESKLPVRQRKVFYVPKTVKPLYDTITKRVLKPGDELPNSDDETDESWLYHKQRDGINDFTDEDVTLEEKEFIHMWNPFIVKEHLTSNKHLPSRIIHFVEENKPWLAEKASRKKEFLKLMENFILKGSVDEPFVRRCLFIIAGQEKATKEAKKEKDPQEGEDIDMDRVEGETAPPSRSLHTLHTCKCGEYTQPPNRVVCRGINCQARFFCSGCAKAFGRPIVGLWKCNDCIS